MLELYHHGSSVCAAKVRFALAQKNVHVDTLHYVDILKGEQFDPAFLRINPKAVVPSLVHDGRVVNESTVICEYVNDVFPGPSLAPKDPYARSKMLIWTKIVDEQLHPACAELTFVCCHRHIISRLGDEGLEQFLDNTPADSVTTTWKRRKREIVRMGFDAPGIKDTIRLYDKILKRMEAALAEGAWLAGDAFSLADIAVAPYVNRLDMMSMAGMWAGGRLPRVEDWFSRIKALPSFKSAFLDWCPEELTNDLKRYGERSWPAVRDIISTYGGDANG
ncbi:MAG: glutathione S-transferase family protein [Hyphomonadaceae bacterium]|nr:glutathione S-transferase family protein [Hyphomonadaceae bacterium]